MRHLFCRFTIEVSRQCVFCHQSEDERRYPLNRAVQSTFIYPEALFFTHSLLLHRSSAHDILCFKQHEYGKQVAKGEVA